jgi:hypothetical protein
MEASTIRAIARPILCAVLIGGWTAMIFCHIDVPAAYATVACLAGLEWISERAIKRFKEMFSV